MCSLFYIIFISIILLMVRGLFINIEIECLKIYKIYTILCFIVFQIIAKLFDILFNIIQHNQIVEIIMDCISFILDTSLLSLKNSWFVVGWDTFKGIPKYGLLWLCTWVIFLLRTYLLRWIELNVLFFAFWVEFIREAFHGGIRALLWLFLKFWQGDLKPL